SFGGKHFQSGLAPDFFVVEYLRARKQSAALRVGTGDVGCPISDIGLRRFAAYPAYETVCFCRGICYPTAFGHR
ncbi:MAG: hypothetical protein LBU43_09555, partial [Candidatus Accumulibacter sp.]|nr:hypothetical protein [Accumulibacter sp.]